MRKDERYIIMKTKRLLICLLTAGIMLLLAACGSSEKAYSVNERFSIGDDKCALEKCEKVTGTDSANAYNISLLIVGNDAPVIMNMNGGQTSTTSGINMVLNNGDEKIEAKDIQFSRVENQGDYGVRATFRFNIPKDTELPEKATLINNSNKEETVLLDLKNLPGFEN